MTQHDHDVLVAGAGPAGLTTAVAAARHGAPVLLVERRPARSSYPRATGGMGGTGMNTAVHAGHNLGWRLARAARGLGGDSLLDGYEAERRPIGRENVLRSLGRGGPPGSTGSLEHDRGGGRIEALTSAVPSVRAPHVPVRHDGRPISTLDLLDGRLTC